MSDQRGDFQDIILWLNMGQNKRKYKLSELSQLAASKSHTQFHDKG